jgi:hypothetical protein
MLSRRLGYIDEAQETAILAHCAEVARLINGLTNSLGPTDH